MDFTAPSMIDLCIQKVWRQWQTRDKPPHLFFQLILTINHRAIWGNNEDMPI
jgi:hypothetical protein